MYSKNNRSIPSSQYAQAAIDCLINTYSHNDFGQIRTLNQGGEPWLVAKDVAEILGYSDTNAMTRYLDDDESMSVKLTGMNMAHTIISEPGFYSAVIRSRVPGAQKFKRWVTHDVLPTIRKHGMYATPDFLESALADPDTMIGTLQALKAERTKRLALEMKNNEMQPKALFADAVSASTSSILVGELSKILRQNGIHTGQNRLFAWLRDNGYLIRRKGSDFNMPTQKSMELGLFEIKERIIVNSDDRTRVTKTSKVTGKGQQYFISMFLGQSPGQLPKR